jgi:hypothetical protein
MIMCAQIVAALQHMQQTSKLTAHHWAEQVHSLCTSTTNQFYDLHRSRPVP